MAPSSRPISPRGTEGEIPPDSSLGRSDGGGAELARWRGRRTQQRPEYTTDRVSITPYPRIPLARMPCSDMTDDIKSGNATKPGIVGDERQVE